MSEIPIYVEKGDIQTVGMKAFNLYRCKLLDISVPEFVVIPTYWFRKYKAGKLKNGFYLKLKKVFSKFNCDLAVRSSSLVEDLNNKSNAGIFKTELGIDTGAKLLAAVKDVWLSSIDSSGVDMAVIIQKQVTPEFSGVLFTRNPMNGNNETIIEYIDGLGDKLVSGKKTPIKVVLNNNKIKTTFDRSAKTTRAAMLMRLFKLSKKLEAKFGYPLDIEWAKCRDGFHILQARPITTLKIPHKDQGKTYSRVPAEQFYSGPVSPLFSSIFEHMYTNYYIKDTLNALGIAVRTDKILIRYKSYLYIDTSIAQTIFKNYPIKNKEFLTVLPEDIREDLIKTSNGISVKFIFKLLKLMLKNPNYWITKLDKYFNNIVVPSIIQQLEAIPQFKNMNKDQLNLSLTRLLEIANMHIQTSKWGLGLYIVPLLTALEKIINRNNISSNKMQSLISNLEVNKTLDASLELKKLSMIIKENKQTYNVFKNDLRDYLDYREALERVDNGGLIIDHFEFILKKYGHRRLSRDILTPSWNDEPMIPFMILKKLVLERSQDKYTAQERVKIERQDPIKMNIDNIIGDCSFKDRILIKILIKYAIRYIGFRELQRFYLDMIISKMRELMLELSNRMLTEGFITNMEDIFYLELYDIKSYLTGVFDLNLNKKIEFNKVSFQHDYKYSQKSPGKFLRSGVEFDSVQKLNRKNKTKQSQLSSNQETVNTFIGQPVSPGYFKGTARVIDHIDCNLELEKNEILVTSSIDPGQTHAFLLAGALVCLRNRREKWKSCITE